jgi:hypothetical protein
MSEKKFIDWELVERDYRAGIKTLRQIAEEHGVSHVAIQKRAKKELWSRDLTQKVQQRANELVTKALVTNEVTKEQKASEVETVRAYGEIVANVDLSQREDVKLAMANARGMLLELVQLSKPEFAEVLQWMALNFDESADNFKDKANEAYRYIISLSGRVKMAKELAGVHGVYVPLQRKIYKLDDDDSRKSSIDDLLTIIGT